MFILSIIVGSLSKTCCTNMYIITYNIHIHIHIYNGRVVFSV